MSPKEESPGKHLMNLKDAPEAMKAEPAGKAAPKKRRSAPKKTGERKTGKPKAAKPAAPEEAPADAPAKEAAAAPAAPSRDFVMPDLGRLAINLLHAANLGQKAARQLMRNDDTASDASHTLHDLQRVEIGRAHV